MPVPVVTAGSTAEVISTEVAISEDTMDRESITRRITGRITDGDILYTRMDPSGFPVTGHKSAMPGVAGRCGCLAITDSG